MRSGDEEMEFMPIVPIGEPEMGEDEIKTLPTDVPIIALRNTVLFPNVVLPITVARDKSIRAIEAAVGQDKWIGVVAQQDPQTDDPGEKDIYWTGTLARIVKQIQMPDATTTLFIMGRVRFRMSALSQQEPYLRGKIKPLVDLIPQQDPGFDALLSSIKDDWEKFAELNQNLYQETTMVLRNLENPSFLLHFVASQLQVRIQDKQALLTEDDVVARARTLLQMLHKQVQVLELKHEITNKARADIDRQQREYLLQQQLKSIREELGGDPNDREIKDLQKRSEEIELSEPARELFDRSIQKLERMHPSTPDYSVIYNHLDLILDLPWKKYTEDQFSMSQAESLLNNQHYGMHKIKERILEYLAVLKLRGDLKSPILCFVGPPGIGKTSLAKSIATSINRRYVRLSLGGLHDESEIRGHRKTYIGAMPGRIIQSLRKVKTSNPVIVLDEIDKVGRDFRGDPSSALLEILDPEQNHSFYDNYLELEFDLSKVLFVATANSLSNIQPALRDRMEIIELSGYSTEEKLQIAKRHLIPKQKEVHGLQGQKFRLTDKLIRFIIEKYTREAGVRELERMIAAIMRALAIKVVNEKPVPGSIPMEMVEEALGKPKFSKETYTRKHPPGVAVGLAWTAVGGEILFIESALTEGNGQLTLTGNLGNVMKESASTALTFLKSEARRLGIESKKLAKSNIHIHVPEGSVPKDGPSAGITMLTALASAFMGRKVKPYLAMTGEITLRGQVLPVGGIKEKILAAKRSGIREIILCEQNRKDVEEIPAEYIKNLKFHYVQQMREVLDLALGE